MRKAIFLPVLLVLAAIGTVNAQYPQPNNWYRLENGQNKKYISNGNARNEGAGVVAKGLVDTDGAWRVESLGNGKFRIQNQLSGMYLANFGQRKSETPIKQTGSPGPGAIWKFTPLQGGYFSITSDLSGLYIGLGGQQDSAPIVQTSNRSGMTTWRFVPATSMTSAAKQSSTPTSQWTLTTLPSKYFGKWRLYSRNASKNDLVISAGQIQDGAMYLKTLKTYEKDGVYKVITTMNGYYECYFIKDRQGGIGDGGIYVLNFDGGWRDISQAINTQMPAQGDMDQGFR